MVLSAEESHHAVAVLRAKPGQEVVLFDGAGREAVAWIVGIDRRLVRVDVRQPVQHPFELSSRITLAVAMTRPHRHAYLIEKCTELGVAAIWPIIAERSVGKGDPQASVPAPVGNPRRLKSKARPARKRRTRMSLPAGVSLSAGVDKWSRRAIEAAKQSGRSWVPTIATPQEFLESTDRIGEFDAASLTHPDPTLMPFDRFLASGPAGRSVLVWVGPEGGWSRAEHDRAVDAGAVLTTLGPTVLRTETAAVAVCAAAALQSISDRKETKAPRQPGA